MVSDEIEVSVSIPHKVWDTWQRWCKVNGYDPHHKLISVMRIWASDYTYGELHPEAREANDDDE